MFSVVNTVSNLTGLSSESSTTLLCLAVIAIGVFTFSKVISVVVKSIIVAALLFFMYAILGPVC